MAKRKTTYKDASNKKAVRDFLFSLFAKQQLSKIVGLGGPDINDYIDWCKSKGFNEFEIYENHTPTLFEQIRKIKAGVGVNLKYGDILNADANRKNVLFDLDYCVTTRYMSQHIKKFKGRFIMTFSRRLQEKETISTFFKARGEKLIQAITNYSPLEHTIFKTDVGNKYIYVKYHDTSSMCCFAKIN